MASRAPDLTRAEELRGPAGSPPQLRLCAQDWRMFDTPQAIARWDALAQWTAEPNPFYESWYLLPSLRALDPGGKVELLCLEADGQLAGLMPLRRESRYYGHPLPQLRNWVHANCFLGLPLVARGFEAAFWRELLDWCDTHARRALFLHLSHMPAAGPLHEALAAMLQADPRPAATVMREERAMLASDLAPEVYLEESLSGKKRKELRRQHRRLAEEGQLTVERKLSTDALDSWIEEFLRLERAGWKGAAGSALACDVPTETLFADALHGAAQRGRLERLAIRLDGRAIAMLASFLCPPGAFSYKTAFDESHARFSPGVLLQRENLEMLNDPAIAWTDSCASADHPMIDHFWRERRVIVRSSIGIGGTVRRRLFGLIAARETGAPARGIA